VAAVKKGTFIAKERQIRCRMYGVQNKVYLNLHAAYITVIWLLVKFLIPFRHISR